MMIIINIVMHKEAKMLEEGLMMAYYQRSEHFLME